MPGARTATVTIPTTAVAPATTTGGKKAPARTPDGKGAAAAPSGPAGKTVGKKAVVPPPVVTAGTDEGKVQLLAAAPVEEMFRASLTSRTLNNSIKAEGDAKIARDLKVYYVEQRQFLKDYPNEIKMAEEALADVKSVQFPNIRADPYRMILTHFLANYLGDRFILGASPEPIPLPKISLDNVLDYIKKTKTLHSQLKDLIAMKTTAEHTPSELDVLKSEAAKTIVLAALRGLSATKRRGVAAFTFADIEGYAPTTSRAPVPHPKPDAIRARNNQGDAGSSDDDDDDDAGDENNNNNNSNINDRGSENSDEEYWDNDATGGHPVGPEEAPSKNLSMLLRKSAEWRQTSIPNQKGKQLQELLYARYLEIYSHMPGHPPHPTLVKITIRRTLPCIYDEGLEGSSKTSREQRGAISIAHQILSVCCGNYTTHVILLGISRFILESILRHAGARTHRAFAISQDLTKYFRAPANFHRLIGHVGNLCLSRMEEAYGKKHDIQQLHADLSAANGSYDHSFINLIEAFTGSEDTFKNFLILVPALARGIITGPMTTSVGDLSRFEKEVRLTCLTLYYMYEGIPYAELGTAGLKALLAGHGHDASLAENVALDEASASCAVLAQARELYDADDGSGFAQRLQIKARKGVSAASAGGTSTTHFSGSMVVKREAGATTQITQLASTRRQREESDEEDNADEKPEKPRPKITSVDISKVLRERLFKNTNIIRYLKVGAPCLFHGDGGPNGSHTTRNCNMFRNLSPQQKAKIREVHSSFPK